MAATQESSTNPISNQRTGSGGRPTTLSEQTSKVAEDVRELGHIALSGAGDALHSVKERGTEMLEKGLEKGKAKAEDARASFEGYVAENPFKSVLIAAGIGALIGYSLRRRE
jgi:ElaB/YqjD/DUF883 family membrane-anchored ribosome-binding protein